MPTLAQLEEGAARALSDVQQASARVGVVNTRVAAILAETEKARRVNDLEKIKGLLPTANLLAKEMVDTRAEYQKAVEFATLMQAMVNLKKAGNDEAVGLGIETMRRLSKHKFTWSHPPAVKLKSDGTATTGLGLWPFDGTDLFKHVDNATKTVGDAANAVGQAFGDAANWAGQNAPQIAGVLLPIAGAAAGAYFGGPAGLSAGMSVGGALAAAFQQAKPGVAGQAPLPNAPSVNTGQPFPGQQLAPGQVPQFVGQQQMNYPGNVPGMPMTQEQLRQQWIAQQGGAAPAFNDPARALAGKTFGTFNVKQSSTVLAVGGAVATVLILGAVALKG